MVGAKRIWFLWYQGKNNMPEIVNMCYQSWCQMNKDFDVILLDKNNLKKYLELDQRIERNKNLSIQALSDIIRINLLSLHGGIWVDATCYCMRPINSWIDKYLENGFFAFASPGPDRMISSWFLASVTNNLITIELTKYVNNYWLENPQMRNEGDVSMIKKVFLKLFRTCKSQSDTSYWFSYFFRKVIKVYPYYYFHYLFCEAHRNEKEFRTCWDNTVKYSADIPHKLKLFGFNKIASPEIRKEIDQRAAPLYKLSFKFKYDFNKENSVMNYLIKAHNNISST